MTDGHVSYALVLKPVLLHLTFSLVLAMFLRNPPSVSIKVGICSKAGATSVERISAQSYIGLVVVRTTAQHIVVGNFSISRNKDYGCGSPRTDITTHIIADCSISYPSSSCSMHKAYIGISFFLHSAVIRF